MHWGPHNYIDQARTHSSRTKALRRNCSVAVYRIKLLAERAIRHMLNVHICSYHGPFHLQGIVWVVTTPLGTRTTHKPNPSVRVPLTMTKALSKPCRAARKTHAIDAL
jgi:hypothetical protein